MLSTQIPAFAITITYSRTPYLHLYVNNLTPSSESTISMLITHNLSLL